jgi:hypothetical protein
MRFLSIMPWLLTAIVVSGCDSWPRNLESFADSVAGQVSGDTTAWLVSGDVVVIDVANSPLYQSAPAELEAVATDIADQAIAFLPTPLESAVVTFHEGAASDDLGGTRTLVFLVLEDRPVLQPLLDLDATGPLTIQELEAQFIGPMDGTLTEAQRECVLEEAGKLAQIAGDPEAVDPASLDFLPAETWEPLDEYAKRLVLKQAITTEALFTCARRGLR